MGFKYFKYPNLFKEPMCIPTRNSFVFIDRELEFYIALNFKMYDMTYQGFFNTSPKIKA